MKAYLCAFEFTLEERIEMEVFRGCKEHPPIYVLLGRTVGKQDGGRHLGQNKKLENFKCLIYKEED